MKLIDKISKKPITPVMLVLGFLLMGLISFYFVPINLMPNMEYPGLTLETKYPGMNPNKIEEIITKPLEDVISKVGGLIKMLSTSEEGKSRIYLEFAQKTNLDIKSMEIRAMVDLKSGGFPREVQEPVLLKYNPEQKPIMIVTMEGKQNNLEHFREIAENKVKKFLEGIPGISEIIIAGGRVREILVDIDQQLLKAHKLSTKDILIAIQRQNINTTVGEVHQDGGRFSLHIKGRFSSLFSIRKLSLLSENNRTIFLEDIAKIFFTYREPDSASRVNGVEKVSLYIQKSAKVNLLTLSNKIKSRLEKLQTENLRFNIIYDRADLIKKAISQIFIKGIFGLFLAFIAMVLLLKNFLKGAVAILIILFSFIISTFLFYLTGLSFNLLSLSGILISVGLALAHIVYIFNSTVKDNSAKGMGQLFPALITSVFIVSGIFLPLVFADQDMKIIYGNMAIAIFFITGISLLLSYIIIPLVFQKWPANDSKAIENLAAFFQNHIYKPISQKLILSLKSRKKIYRFINFFSIKKIAINSQRVIFVFFQKPRLFIFFLFFLLITELFFFIFSKKELINPLQEKQITANVEFPSGSSFGLSNRITQKVEKKLKDLPEIKEITSKVDPAHSSLNIKIMDGVQISDSLLKYLEKKAGQIKPAFVYFSEKEDAGSLKEITINVLGEEISKIDRITKKLAKESWKIQGISSVVLRYKSPRPEVRIKIDQIKAQKAGLSPAAIGQFIRYRVHGGVATKYIERNRELDVRIRFKKKYRSSFDDLKRYKLKNSQGKFIPLFEVAAIKESKTPVKIYRLNKKRMLSYSVRLKDNAGYKSVLSSLEKIFDIPLPENYRIEFSQDIKRAIKTEKNFIYFFILAFLFIYMILSSYFESLISSLILISSTLVPYIFILLSFSILNIPISISIYIGMILIFGLVISQSLVIYKSFPNANIIIKNKVKLITLTKHLVRLLNESFQTGFIIICFFMPLLFISQSGNTMLKQISLTIVMGIPVTVISVPFFCAFTYILQVKYKNKLNLLPNISFGNWRLSSKKYIFCFILIGLLLKSANLLSKDKLELDINSAIRIGVTNHFTLKIIKKKKKAIHKLITERWRSFAPNLMLGYSRLLDESKGLRDYRGHEIRLDIEQILYDGGKRSLDLDIAKLESLLASNDFKINYNNIRQKVQEDFVNAIADKGKIFLNKKSVQRSQARYKLIMNKMKQGFATKIAALDALARLQGIKLTLSRSKIEFKQSIHNLKRTLNLDYSVDIDIIGDLFEDFIIRSPHVRLDSLIARARKFRPEIIRSRVDISRSKKLTKVEKNYWKPKITVNGYMSQSGEHFPVRDQDMGVNFSVELPFGDTPSLSQGGISKKNANQKGSNINSQANVLGDLSPGRKILEAKNNLTEALYSSHQLDNSVAIQVHEAYDNLLEAWDAIHMGNIRVYAQYQKLIVMGTRYSVGRAIRSETLEAETDLIKAQEDLTNAIARYIINAIKLENAASMEPGELKLFSYNRGKGNSLLVEMKDKNFRLPQKSTVDLKEIEKFENFSLDEEIID